MFNAEVMWKILTMTNALAYHNSALITKVKGLWFMVLEVQLQSSIERHKI